LYFKSIIKLQKFKSIIKLQKLNKKLIGNGYQQGILVGASGEGTETT